uniref:HNH homing endonuclease n=1 Tax=Microglena monadina TaxID=47904 RepID=A0A0S2IBU4_9CHLO|nr:HNH homing endonuclease [Microglena monadina]
MKITPKSKEGWAGIQWVTVEIHVRKLQRRIYLASKGSDIKKVRKLQMMLLASRDAKYLATRRVTQDNKGKKTAGVDGIKLLKPPARLTFVDKIAISGSSKPLRRGWIAKSGKTEKKPLAIPTIGDRIHQELLKLAIEPEWEAKFEPNSYGFRPGRCPHDAIKQIYLCINKKPKYVLNADIRKCFDKINHQKLLVKLGFVQGKIHSQLNYWLKAGVVDKKIFTSTEEGTPQGGVISPLLDNIALHGMETMLKELMLGIPLRTPKGTSMGSRDKERSLSVIRYADDFVVMHENLEVILKCKSALELWLVDIGLELSAEKIKITHTLELSPEEQKEFNVQIPGFNFLGFTIRQFKSKYGADVINGINTIILPSKDKCKTHQEKLALIIRKSKILSQEDLIKKLNPIISGWARYAGVSDAVTYKIFQKMDWLLYLKLRRWSKRKTKSAAAGFNKYWKYINGRWIFASASGIKLFTHVFYGSSIREYVKVIGENSPFDGNETYWAMRFGTSILLSKSQARLLKKQKGRCNLCNEMFREEDLLERDHIIPLSEGGKKAYENLQLLHRHCNDQKASFLIKVP